MDNLKQEMLTLQESPQHAKSVQCLLAAGTFPLVTMSPTPHPLAWLQLPAGCDCLPSNATGIFKNPVLLEAEPRALSMLTKCSTIELQVPSEDYLPSFRYQKGFHCGAEMSPNTHRLFLGRLRCLSPRKPLTPSPHRAFVQPLSNVSGSSTSSRKPSWSPHSNQPLHPGLWCCFLLSVCAQCLLTLLPGA